MSDTTTTTAPVEALILFTKGADPTAPVTIKGGHTIRRDPITNLPSQPIPIGKDASFPWSQISAEINAAALATIAGLNDQVAAAEQAATAAAAKAASDLAAAQQATATAEATLATQTAQIAKLQAQLAAALATPTTPTGAAEQLLAKLNEVFATVPAEYQGQFASEYATVRVLIQAGQPALALAVVQGVAVPDALAAIKAQIVAALQS